MLFNALWRGKRMEWILARVWTKQTSLQKIALPVIPELQPILHTANLLSSEMIHFVHQVHKFTVVKKIEALPYLWNYNSRWRTTLRLKSWNAHGMS